VPFDLELKDLILVTTFGVTVIAAWVKLKLRIDSSEVVHQEIKETLVVMAGDVGEIKTSIAVIETEQKNTTDRLDRMEDREK